MERWNGWGRKERGRSGREKGAGRKQRKRNRETRDVSVSGVEAGDFSSSSPTGQRASETVETGLQVGCGENWGWKWGPETRAPSESRGGERVESEETKVVACRLLRASIPGSGRPRLLATAGPNEV